MRKPNRALFAIIAMLIAACGTPGVGGTVDGSWVLRSGTVDGAPVTMVDGYPITLVLEGDGLGGRAACNQYFGDYSISNGHIAVSGLGQTEMGCETVVMGSESEYLMALAGVDEFEVVGDRLTLSGQGIELVFEALPPVPTAALQGTVWVLDGLIAGDAVSSTVGDRATLELFTDGSVIGSTGCRDFNGEYELGNPNLELTTFNIDGECTSEVRSQDEQVVAVLGDVSNLVVEGGTLTINSPGDLGLVYHSEG